MNYSNYLNYKISEEQKGPVVVVKRPRSQKAVGFQSAKTSGNQRLKLNQSQLNPPPSLLNDYQPSNFLIAPNQTALLNQQMQRPSTTVNRKKRVQDASQLWCGNAFENEEEIDESTLLSQLSIQDQIQHRRIQSSLLNNRRRYLQLFGTTNQDNSVVSETTSPFNQISTSTFGLRNISRPHSTHKISSGMPTAIKQRLRNLSSTQHSTSQGTRLYIPASTKSKNNIWECYETSTLVDDTDHFDGTGMEIRRNKIIQEIQGVEMFKQQAALELLNFLMKFNRLAKRSLKNQPWLIHQQETNSLFFTKTTDQSVILNNQKPQLPLTLKQSITQGAAATSSLNFHDTFNIPEQQHHQGQSSMKSCIKCFRTINPLSQQDQMQAELNEFLKAKNQEVMMKIAQSNKYSQVSEQRKERINEMERKMHQVQKELNKLKYQDKQEVSKLITLRRNILLMISKLKNSVVTELELSKVNEKEPFTGPLPFLLREGFHKPYPEKLQTQSLLVRIERAQSESPVKDKIIVENRLGEKRLTLKKEKLQTKFVEEELKTSNPQDPAYLKNKIAHLESLLRQKTDRTLQTGECKEILIDYRRYETTKVEQFQQMIKKIKTRVQDEGRIEVDRLFNERKVLQLEAYRYAQIMQKKIDSMIKTEAQQIMSKKELSSDDEENQEPNLVFSSTQLRKKEPPVIAPN